jgi:DNA-binding winged helix-turn-helix (wHTH) protein/Tol biopolymer transport system component
MEVESKRLFRGGAEVKLRPQSFEVLRYLVERPGRLVTREELMQALWGDVAVSDESITKCIADIRKALAGDSQRIIRTLPKRGFLFQTEVAVARPPEPGDLSRNLLQPDAVDTRGSIRKAHSRGIMIIALVLVTLCAGGLLLIGLPEPQRRQLQYAQITNFTDSAVSPALSPDGKMLAFIRSDNWFLTPDQIYVKMLPNGEPVQVTHDPRPKYGVAFSADGSRLAYTVSEPGQWRTNIVSPLGGESTLFLSNAAGLTWLDEHRLLFSEVSTGNHMGIVTTTENRSDYRRIYFPDHPRGMAHLSYASPDSKWVLIVEMDPAWRPCRLAPMDGSSSGGQVGPQGHCTSAAWSPDGKWMYFGAEVEGKNHLWRQRFPNGKPEQITTGPTEERGVVVTPDGRSLISSIGTQESAIWMHDSKGERPLTSQGLVTSFSGPTPGSRPTFSPDGRTLFYLLRRESPESPAELWRTDLDSGKSESALPGVSMIEYDVSDDRKTVVFSAQPAGRASQIWLAALDRSSPPRLIASTSEASPHFGPDGDVLFRIRDAKGDYLARMQKDGSGRAKVAPYPIRIIRSISADRRWFVATAPNPDGGVAIIAAPVRGGAPVPVCTFGCPTAWAPDGKFFYVGVVPKTRTSPGRTLAIPVPPGETLPRLPPSGIRGPADQSLLAGARLIEGWDVSPGTDPSFFAYVKTTEHRNLFRIQLPDP